MDDITLQEVSSAIRAVDVTPFIRWVERYMAASGAVDRRLKIQGLLSAPNMDEQERCYEALVQAAGDVRHQSALSAACLIHFRFKLNGQRGTEAGDRAIFYFNGLKKQQIELLSAISDETDIIQSLIERSKKIQGVFQKHSESIHRTAFLMSVIRERISRRPTTLLAVQGQGKKIEQLNQTFQGIRAYEELCHRDIGMGSSDNPSEEALADYLQTAGGVWSEVESRKHQLRVNSGELQQGGKLLVKLIDKGYSRRMRNNLNLLMANHEVRIRKFQEQVYHCRAAYYINEAFTF
jgi:hypothetical protein